MLCGRKRCNRPPSCPASQFEEMYEQRRREVNKEFEKYQKQMRAAKKSGSKAAADKVGITTGKLVHQSSFCAWVTTIDSG